MLCIGMVVLLCLWRGAIEIAQRLPLNKNVSKANVYVEITK